MLHPAGGGAETRVRWAAVHQPGAHSIQVRGRDSDDRFTATVNTLAGDLVLKAVFSGDRTLQRSGYRNGELGPGVLQIDVIALQDTRYRLTASGSGSSAAAPADTASRLSAFMERDLPDARLGAPAPDLALSNRLERIFLPAVGRERHRDTLHLRQIHHRL